MDNISPNSENDVKDLLLYAESLDRQEILDLLGDVARAAVADRNYFGKQLSCPPIIKTTFANYPNDAD